MADVARDWGITVAVLSIGADMTANSRDQDQTAPRWSVWLSLYCVPFHLDHLAAYYTVNPNCFNFKTVTFTVWRVQVFRFWRYQPLSPDVSRHLRSSQRAARYCYTLILLIHECFEACITRKENSAVSQRGIETFCEQGHQTRSRLRYRNMILSEQSAC